MMVEIKRMYNTVVSAHMSVKYIKYYGVEPTQRFGFLELRNVKSMNGISILEFICSGQEIMSVPVASVKTIRGILCNIEDLIDADLTFSDCRIHIFYEDPGKHTSGINPDEPIVFIKVERVNQENEYFHYSDIKINKKDIDKLVSFLKIFE